MPNPLEQSPLIGRRLNHRTRFFSSAVSQGLPYFASRMIILWFSFTMISILFFGKNLIALLNKLSTIPDNLFSSAKTTRYFSIVSCNCWFLLSALPWFATTTRLIRSAKFSLIGRSWKVAALIPAD
jgi:hypothetical protein